MTYAIIKRTSLVIGVLDLIIVSLAVAASATKRPHLGVTPDVSLFTTEVAVTGREFNPGKTVELRFAGSVASAATTDARGWFSNIFRAPANAIPGVGYFEALWVAPVGSTPSAPALANGVLYFVAGDSKLHAFDALTRERTFNSAAVTATLSPIYRGDSAVKEACNERVRKSILESDSSRTSGALARCICSLRNSGRDHAGGLQCI